MRLNPFYMIIGPVIAKCLPIILFNLFGIKLNFSIIVIIYNFFFPQKFTSKYNKELNLIFF